jgi:hypothetical protein
MDHARLRKIAGDCRANQMLGGQGLLSPNHIITNALGYIADLADAVASGGALSEADSPDNLRQLSLGEIIILLESWPKQDDACRFDFGRTVPDCAPDSYRGYYDQLAMGYEEEKEYPKPTVAEVLASFKSAVNKEFGGYKGGTYTMTEKTPVWIANYGLTSGTVIVGVYHDKHHFVFRTANID